VTASTQSGSVTNHECHPLAARSLDNRCARPRSCPIVDHRRRRENGRHGPFRLDSDAIRSPSLTAGVTGVRYGVRGRACLRS